MAARRKTFDPKLIAKMKPTTTPFPATSTNSASHLHDAYADLLKLNETAPIRFLTTQKFNWTEAIGADFGSLSHEHQRPPERANSGQP